MSNAPCPTRSQLEDLIAGRLSFERHEAIDEHVRGCKNCQAEVDSLEEPQDAFLSTLRAAIDPAATRAKRPLREALASLKLLRSESVDRHDLAPENGLSRIAGTLGDFRILGELGRGGMGIVYEAEQLSLGRRVALKILPFAALLDPRQLQRFQNEARAAASLEHPNIVSIYGVGVERGVHYYAMRYIDGQNLAQVIEQLCQRAQHTPAAHPTKPNFLEPTQKNGSGLTELLSTRAPTDVNFLRAVVRIGVQAAEALDFAHEHGIVHRDIKPSNLMLDQTGRVWVADFGLAHIEMEGTLSISGGVLGTLRYTSPEQALGKRGVVDHRSDVYSLGVTLYELLTFSAIFPEIDRGALLNRIATDEPKPMRQLNPRIPADLETIVLKAMAKNAAERYQTAGELAADLKRFLESKPVLARRVGRAERALKWARRKPALAALLTLGVLATVGLLIGSWWHAATLQSALDLAYRLREEADQQRATAYEREQRVRHFLYASDMKQAYAAWNNSHVSETVALLERHRPKAGEEDLRSFVWYYLWRLCHGELRTLHGHAGDVHCVVFSPDGRRLATASHDGTAKIWDAATGQELASFLKGHQEELDAVAFSPDGKTLATAGDDRKVRLWDTASGQERAVLVGHAGDVNTVAFSPDGKMLASGSSDRIVRLWNASTGKESALLAGHKGAIEALAFSPDGKLLATASGDHTAMLWDLATRQPRTNLRGHEEVLRSVTFAHDGRTLATGSEDRTVMLWDTKSGQTKATLRGHGEVVRCVEFSADDRTLAVAVKDGSVWIWEVATGRVQNIIRGHTARIWSVSNSPDGKTLATASGDHTVKLWNKDAGQATRIVSELGDVVKSLALAPDGNLLAVSFNKSGLGDAPPPELWHIDATPTRLPLSLSHNDPRWFSFCPSGEMLASADRWGHVELYDVQSWQRGARIDFGKPDNSFDARSAMAWSSDSQTLATWSLDGRIDLWNVPNRQKRATLGSRQRHMPVLRAAAFSPDGASLATGGFTGTLTIWDAHALRERVTLTAHGAGILSLAFSADGQLLVTASTDRTIKVWDVETLKERATLQGHLGTVNCVAFCPAGNVLASGSEDGTVRLWDTSTWQEIIALEAHKRGVTQITFSSDGRTLVSGGTSDSGKGEVALWPAPAETSLVHSD